MLHEFMHANRRELAGRCRRKSAVRSSPASTEPGVEHGVPMLIDQLVDLLRGEHAPDANAQRERETEHIRGAAEQHGGDLLRRGFTVDQVVHDYGDLCQAVTELAADSNERITVDEFQMFNRCLDIAIAKAVTEFGRQRDQVIADRGIADLNERLGSLAHELRNLLNTASLAYAAIKVGTVSVSGATGAILERSLDGLRDLINGALADVRLSSGLQARRESTPLDVILEEVSVAAKLEAAARNLVFTVKLEHALSVSADRQMLSSALANILQNAFKFTRPRGHVQLSAHVAAGRVLIEVEDQCGGLPPGDGEQLFEAFTQRSGDRSGVGLGLSISRRGVEASGGTMRVRDLPGRGCVFTIDLPQS